MFTGLIQALGHLHFVDRDHVQIRCLEDPHPGFIADLELGDSIAVDGICLTVEAVLSTGFVAATSPETLERTTLSLPQTNQNDRIVNLEPSLRVGDKLGGHFVTGHIDGMGYVEAITADDRAWILQIRVAHAQVARYTVPKGSIAVNGISLTIATCAENGLHFQAAIIPHTFENTNLKQLHIGSPVNLEADILGKYVEKLLPYQAGKRHPNSLDNASNSSIPNLEDVDAAFLAAHGYG